MLTDQDIISLIAEKRPLLVKMDKCETVDKRKGLGFTEVYAMSIEQYERIRIHVDLDLFPEKLFHDRAPNQTDIEYDYLKNNYKTVTMPVWERFQSVLSRIWGDQNWSIHYNGDDEAKKYLEIDYPIYGSLETYFKDVVTTVKELDNNGVIALTLYDYPWMPTKNDAGELVYQSISDREEIQPMVHYYNCERLIGFEEGRLAVVITDEKSTVTFGNREVSEGLVIDIYDENTIYRAYQKGRKVDFEFEVIEYYNHNFGYLPVKKLNGKAKQVDGEVFYKSAFISAVPSLDKALLDDSYLSASKSKCAYPKGWEIVSECDYQTDEGNKCIAGLVVSDAGTHKCPSCMGSGMKRPGILGVYQIKAPELGNPNAIPAGAPFGWVAPETNILEFLSAQVDKNLDKGSAILNIAISNSDVKGTETALGKQIDREEQFSFIKRISDQVFALYEFAHKVILQARYGIETELPEITYPRSFALRNDADLTAEIAQANEAGLPDAAKKKLMMEYFQTRFGADPRAQKIIDLIFSVDRLIGLSNEDILKKKASGTVAAWEDVLHTSVEMFIDDLIDSDPEFLNKDKKVKKDLIVNMAKQRALEITPAKVNVDNVLANANA